MTVRIVNGDCREVLRALPAECVHCVVTSPPYWGLRSYGTEPQTWGGDEGCDHAWGRTQRGKRGDMLPIDETTSEGRSGVDERQRTAAHDGGRLCQLCGAWRGELGNEPSLGLHLANIVGIFREVRRVLRKDGTLWLNYGDCYATAPNGKSAADYKAEGNDDRTHRDKPFSTVGPVYDPEGGAKGGGFRGQNKGNQSSPGGRVVSGGRLKPKDLCMVSNRLAIALQEDGWWVRSEIIWAKPNPMPESIRDRPTSSHEKLWLLTKAERYYYDAEGVAEQTLRPEEAKWAGGAGGIHSGEAHIGTRTKVFGADPQRRNLRNVWTIATAPFPQAHFATFPPALVEPCIKAGCPAGGTVLDPFGGAGTVGLVADRLQRNAILIELNPQYAEMAEQRIRGEAPLLAEVGT